MTQSENSGISEYIQFIKEEALQGVCSMRVIDAAHTAEKIISKHGDNQTLIGAKVDATDQSGRPCKANAEVYVKYTDSEDADWIEVGIRAGAGNHLPLITLKDRVREGRCSVAVLDPGNADAAAWAESIVSSASDDHKIFEYNKEGEIQYTAAAVSALNEFLLCADGQMSKNLDENLEYLQLARDNFIDVFRVDEYTRLSLVVDSIGRESDDYEPAPQKYLQTKLLQRLGSMTIGDRVVLSELTKEDGHLSESHVITTTLAKLDEEAGEVDWSITFGTKDKVIGTGHLAPPVLVNSDGFMALSSDGSAKDRLGIDQEELVMGLAKSEGYRDLYKLPEPDFEKISWQEYLKSFQKLQEEDMKEYFSMFGDIESASEELANILYAWGRVPFGFTEGFEVSAIRAFRDIFMDNESLLDIGKIDVDSGLYLDYIRIFTGASHLSGTIVVVNKNRRNVTAFDNASNCESLSVSGCNDVFTTSKNLKNCHAKDVFSAFYFIEGMINDCRVEDARSAFKFGISSSQYVEYISNCEAIDCEESFMSLGDKYSVSSNTRKLRKQLRDCRIIKTKKYGTVTKNIGQRT